MGGDQSSEEESVDNVTINHPRFKDISYLRDKNIIRLNINIDHEQDYHEWEEKLNQIGNLDDEVILLPKAYTYSRKAICGSSGTMNIDFDNYPYVLSDQLKNRRKINRNFDEPEIWYLLYSLISAAHDFKKLGSKVGDIRPENIFINEEGQIKTANLFSFPSETTNYIKTLYENERTYLAPEQIASIQQGQQDTFIDKFKAEAFSIGITVLETANLKNFGPLYPTAKSFNQSFLNNQLQEWWKMTIECVDDETNEVRIQKYSPKLKIAIAALCDSNVQSRLDSEDVYQWLKKFHQEINELKYFEPDMPPVRDINRYSQFLRAEKAMGPHKLNSAYPPDLNRSPNQYHKFQEQYHKFQGNTSQPSSHQQFFNLYSDPHPTKPQNQLPTFGYIPNPISTLSTPYQPQPQYQYQFQAPQPPKQPIAYQPYTVGPSAATTTPQTGTRVEGSSWQNVGSKAAQVSRQAPNSTSDLLRRIDEQLMASRQTYK